LVCVAAVVVVFLLSLSKQFTVLLIYIFLNLKKKIVANEQLLIDLFKQKLKIASFPFSQEIPQLIQEIFILLLIFFFFLLHRTVTHSLFINVFSPFSNLFLCLDFH